MQPSSLVFLVIIAVWAAYFVQYWVRRREHLATTRSVDQFSESMRVLERRNPLPAADLSTPQPRSYAVAPARPARAQILVKRAASAELPASPASSGAPHLADRRDERPADRRDERTAARRTRAMILLGALSTVLVTVPLVALGLLPLATLLVPVASIGVAVGWVRTTAVAEQRARRAARPVSAPAPARRPRQTHDAAFAREETASHAAPDAAPDPEAVEARSELFDVQAVVADARKPAQAVASAETVERVEPAQPAPMRPLVDEDDIPLTWDPGPVPRPTYTMKSRATRPAPAAADLVGDADTEYTAYEQEPVRRVAGA
ncbi:MAG: hypothetical protein ACTHMZ_13840 [Actinomycetes bacterium]